MENRRADKKVFNWLKESEVKETPLIASLLISLKGTVINSFTNLTEKVYFNVYEMFGI